MTAGQDAARLCRPTVFSAVGGSAYYLVRTAGGTVSISVYENEAGANESNSAAANWIRENLPEVGGSAPQVSAGEVVITA